MNGFTSENPIPLPSSPTSETNTGGPGLPGSFEGIKQKRRGRPKGTTGSGSGKRREQSEAQDKPQAPRIQLFTPESVRPIVSLPFNLACVKTGFDGFLLQEDEAQILSTSGAVVLNTWVTIDPKFVALLMFSISMLSITAEKSLLYHRWAREMEAERKRRESEGNAAA
jgi:hypothetical protein